MNNESIRNAATEVVQNHIRRQLSPAATRAIQVMAATIDGLNPLFQLANQEINLMAIHEQQAVDALPEGLWEKLPKNKKVIFLAEVNRAVAVINRGQEKLGNLIKEQAAALDSLSPKALEELMKIQDTILKTAQPKPQRAPRKRKETISCATIN
ncbi:hypothetical protein [Rufibacter soli]